MISSFLRKHFSLVPKSRALLELTYVEEVFHNFYDSTSFYKSATPLTVETTYVFRFEELKN